MSSIFRGLYLAVAVVLLSPPLLADNGTVLHLSKSGSAAGEKTVPVGATITFSSEGMIISSEQGAIAFDSFDAIEFSADRSAATPSQSGSGSTPGTMKTVNIQYPAPVYPEPKDLGQGETTPEPGPDDPDPPTPVTYDLSGATITVKGTYVYTGEAVSPEYTVTYNGTQLTAHEDFTAQLSDNTNVGTATITITAVDGSSYTGSTSQTFTIAPCDLSEATVSTEQSTYIYTGLAIEPVVTVVLDGKTLTKNVDYTVSYNKNVNAGTAVINVRGKDNYTGSVESAFTIEKPVPESDIVVTLDDEAIEPIVDPTNTLASYKCSHGEVTLIGYSAETGDSVTLMVYPKSGYVISSFLLSENLDYKESPITGTSMQYKYAKPAGKLTIAIVFEEKQADGIAENTADGLRFTVIDRQTVRITGAEETAKVNVFDARGQHVAADVQRSETDIVVRLASQPQSLYIIQVNNNTFKIYKK
jgi:hypothetical protein